MFISMGITWAVTKVIEGFKTLTDWATKYSEKATDAAEKSKSLESQITDVNGQLSDTKLKIAELNAIESPTIIQQEELDRLISTNDELERLLKSLNAQAGDAANQAADATMEWWKDIIKNTSTYNNSNVFSPNVTVNGGWTEKEIADTVVKEMEKVFTQYCNTIK